VNVTDAHDHGPGHHHHGAGADTNVGLLARALALIVAFMAAEVVLGVVAHSIALLSDAAHMLVDAAALATSVWAARLARRPPGGRLTFGLKRAEILSAQANGITLLVLGVAIVGVAAHRLVSPPEVHGLVVVVVAAVGAAVNVVALLLVAGANRASLNVEGSFKHLLTDLYAFVATAISGLVVLTTGFDRADPIASLAVAASMLWAAGGLLRASGRVLLEGSPEGVDPDELARVLAAHEAVTNVHDLHVWEITSGFPALSAHVLVEPAADCHATRRELEAILHERFGIDHTTLQVDHSRNELLRIEPARPKT
jgi:cobalt-zinc-cadmium efflux system protein